MRRTPAAKLSRSRCCLNAPITPRRRHPLSGQGHPVSGASCRVETMACTGPGAMVGKSANVATDERCDRSPSGCRHGRADDPCGGLGGAVRPRVGGRLLGVADARRVRRRRGPRAEPESIPARVRARGGLLSGGRGRGGEQLGWALPPECPAWPVVDLCGDPTDVLDGVDAQVGAFGK